MALKCRALSQFHKLRKGHPLEVSPICYQPKMIDQPDNYSATMSSNQPGYLRVAGRIFPNTELQLRINFYEINIEDCYC